MSSEEENRQRDEEGDAIARRLARLRDRPLDMAAFEAKIKAAIPPPQAKHVHVLQNNGERPTWNIFQLFSPFRAIAAVLLIALTSYFAFLALSPQPVLAHPDRMASIYQDAVERHGHGATNVTTIDEAKSALSASWKDVPALPEGASEMQLMSCCVHEIGRKRMACVTFEVDKESVTLALAPAKDIRCPEGEVREVDGIRYILGSSNGVNMVMVEQDGNWSCVMGRLSQDRLIAVLASLKPRGSLRQN